MQKEIDAALKAAKAYKIRGEGDRPHAELIIALLADASGRTGRLEEFAEAYDKQQRIAAAQDELRKAQTA